MSKRFKGWSEYKSRSKLEKKKWIYSKKIILFKNNQSEEK